MSESETFKTTMGARGTIIIPKDLREKAHKWPKGTLLQVTVCEVKPSE